MKAARIGRGHDSMMRLGIFFPSAPGLHQTSALVAARNPDPLVLTNTVLLAQESEALGLDFIFIADRWAPHGPAATQAGFQDPMFHAPLLTSYVAAVTDQIGLVTTFHTTYHHPVHLARMGANLHQLSGGRWGVNIVTGFGADEAALFNIDAMDHDERYEMAAEFLDVTKRMWVGDTVDFDGRWFEVQGRIVGPFIAGEHPLIVNAGSSPAGRDFAARHADWIFLPAEDESGVGSKLADIAERTAAYDRSASVRALLHVSVIVRDTDSAAEDVAALIRDEVDIDAARDFYQSIVGGMETYRRMFADRDEQEVLRHFGSGAAAIRLHGSSSTVAERIIDLHRNYDCRGLAMSFPMYAPEDVARLRPVLSELTAAHVWSPPSERGYSW